MEYNQIPKTGTIGGMVDNITANFQLTKEMLERLEVTKDHAVGLFSTLATLQAAYPSPEVGDWALVGDTTPFAIYKCTTAGTWSDTGGTYDGGTIDLSDYVKQQQFAELAAEVAGGCARISLAGAALSLVSVRFYGVCAGHTYRLYIQRPSVDMTGVNYTTSGYAMLEITRRDKSGNKMPSETDVVKVGCNKKSEPLAAYYDINIDASMTEIDNIQVAMRAASGWVQWFQLEDITESVNDKGYVPNISLIGTGNDIAYSAFYKGVKGGRKYRILIKTPDIDMSGVTNTNSRLIIYLVNLATMVVDTTSQVVRWNKKDTLPDYYDLTVPDDGINYALHYCMRATAGAEQILEVIDMTDFGDGGGGGGDEGGVPDPMSVSGSTDRNDMYNTGYTAKAFTSGHTYRVYLSDAHLELIDPAPGSTWDIFNIILAPEHDGTMPPDSGDSSWEGRSILLKVAYKERPLQPYYDFPIPNDGQKWHVRFSGRCGDTMTFSFEDLTEGEEDTASGTGGTSMLSLVQGNIDTNGKADNATDYVHTSPIAGGRGFFLLLNEGYEIHDIRLFTSDGTLICHSYLPLGVNCSPSSVYKRESGLRCYYGNMSMPQGYYMSVIITKVTTTGGTRSEITPQDKAVMEFTYMDNPHLHYTSPTADPWVGTQTQYDALTAAQKASLDCIIVEGDTAVSYIPRDKAGYVRERYKQLTNVVWTPRAVVPVSQGASTWPNYLYLEGESRIGTPYSEVAQYEKYLGVHVSLYTFLTAVHNKRSVLYTEDLNKRTSSYGYTYGSPSWVAGLIAPFYGCVCSGLTAHALDLKSIYTAALYNPTRSDKVPNFESVEVDFDNLMPLDIIAYKTHVSMCSDVIYDDDGNRKFIVWTEQTRPVAMSSPMTKEVFDARVAAVNADSSRGPVYIMRYTGWSNVSKAMEEPVQTDLADLPRNIEYVDDICTHLGDKPSVGLNDILYLNCFRNSKYTSCVIEKSTDHGATWSAFSTIDISSLAADTLYPEDGEDWVRVDLCATKTYGLYRAHLEGGGATSGYTHWEVIDNTASIIKESGATNATISFANDYCNPYLVQRCRRANAYLPFGEPRYPTVLENSTGKMSVDWVYSESLDTCARIFWRGDYGVVFADVELPKS